VAAAGIALVALAAFFDHRASRTPGVLPDRDVVRRPEPAPATLEQVRQRSRLTCAAAYAGAASGRKAHLAAQREGSAPSADAGTSRAERQRRMALLRGLPFEELVKQATPAELNLETLTRMLARTKTGTPLTAAENDLDLFQTLEAEVNNGGFHQFFLNSSGDAALETRQAVARIGPPALVALYECALTAFPGAKPEVDRRARNEQLAKWGDDQFKLFEDLDEAFFAMGARDELDTPLAAFIQAHAAEVKLPPG
jgi:hypothetical protein